MCHCCHYIIKLFFISDPTNLCIDAKLQKHATDIEKFDVIVNRPIEEEESERTLFWPFVGKLEKTVNIKISLYLVLIIQMWNKESV